MEYFCSLELSDGEMVNWKKKTTLLEEKNLFSLLRVYEQAVFLSRFHNRQVWSRPEIPPFPPPTLQEPLLVIKGL